MPRAGGDTPYPRLPQVFGKGAKFSMFKPAEEMVYIALDEESRTKGKAAIDVVGAQSGKSAGSVLQQLLLLATGGVMAGERSLAVCASLSCFDCCVSADLAGPKTWRCSLQRVCSAVRCMWPWDPLACPFGNVLWLL